VGAVYELGALRALEESIRGLRLNRLDVYVGVSAGAFIAASLANRISCKELCRIFMGVNHAELKFLPERFLRPAYREYVRRARRVPSIVRETLAHMLRHPTHIGMSELIAALGKALPSGIFDNETIHDFLEAAFEAAGKGNRFEDLDAELFVVAVDLDTGAAVRFGSDEHRDVPVSRAVQASAALPGLYPPVRIGDRHYVDGALRRTLHASVALDRGVDLLLGVNPLVPFSSGNGRVAPHLEPRRLISGGLPLILSQTFRALIQSRMQVGFAKYRNSHPAADLLLMEPDRDDEEIFFTNIFSYSSRAALCEHAFQATRRDLLAQAETLDTLLEPYDMALDRDKLADPTRTLLGSIDHTLESHSRVSRSLSRALDDLEDLLDGAA
jgi:predicted acylesterase/phospholipase RssA